VKTAFALVTEVEHSIAGLRPGQFLTLDYDSGDPGSEPYAQLAVEPDELYLEVVSERYLPDGQWPINTAALRTRGWLPPDSDTANWWCTASDTHAAARSLVTALMVARACREVERFSVSIGTFPPPPDGGEPGPDTDAATVAA
jgi:hypothetical protein